MLLVTRSKTEKGISTTSIENSLMKKSLIVLVSAAALTSQAALVLFDLSPTNTDVALGLSPSNEVPPVTNSTGSGNAISGGIVFDTDTLMLQLAVGYGSAAGFTDLTGPAASMHIHGPAGPGTNAGVLVDLAPYHFPAGNPATGGIIVGNIAFPSNAVPDLLAGLTYLNIHTVTNPGGEIRGQLIAVVATNAPPSVSCAPPITVECPNPTELTIAVSDPDGDALTVVWSVNGTVMQTNTLPASSPPAAANVSFSATLPLGTNVVDVLVIDSATNSASCSTSVTVVDTTPPLITAVSATPNVLWPPNHKLVQVRVRATVTDACSSTTWKIIGVTSDEASDARGSGKKTGADWVITSDHTVKLRAERAGGGDGRVYTITVQAQDTSGNLSEPETVIVTVPHDQGNGKGNRGNDKGAS